MILSVDMYPMIYVEENSCTRVYTFSHWFYGWECCQKCIDTKFKLPKMVGNVEEEKSFTFFFIKEEKSFTSFNNHIDNRLIRISLENISLK